MTGVGLVHVMRRVRADLGQAHRYAHSLGVARFAERLAVVHGEAPAKARLAGLLHDLARLYSAERLIDECTARGLPIDAFERANPVVLHARLGAELARDRYAITDEAILSAIRKHTVAAATMSRLDIIIYLADALEPGRTYAAREAMAELALHDLTAALRAVLGSTVSYLRQRALEIAPQTLAAADVFGVPVASVSGSGRELAGTPRATRAKSGPLP